MKGKKQKNTRVASDNIDEDFWKALADSDELRTRAANCRKPARAIALLEQGYRALCRFNALKTINGSRLLRELIDLYVTTGQRERVVALAPLLVYLSASAFGMYSLDWSEAVQIELKSQKRGS